MVRRKAIVGIGLAAAVVVAIPSLGDEEALNRSLYVPVRVSLCEHLQDAVLYRGDEPIQELPGTHVFQFTFYPNLSELLPEHERVRVEGKHDGRSFKAEIIVTPSSVYIGKKRIELDTTTLLTRFRRGIDARHDPVDLVMRCRHACLRTQPAKTARAQR